MSLMRITFKEAAEELKLVTKDDIGHLPNKDEYYEQNGEIIKERISRKKKIFPSVIKPLCLYERGWRLSTLAFNS